MATPYLLERIKINNVTTLGGFTDVELDEGIESSLEAGGTEVNPSLHYAPGVLPLVRGTTLDVGTLIPLALASGVFAHIPITAANTCDVYLQAAADGGTRGTCVKVTLNKGLLVLERVFGSGKLAAAAITIYADYDGTNLPFVIATGQAALTGSSAAASLWRLVALKDNATTIHKLGDWSIDTGVQVARSTPLNTVYGMDAAVFRFAPTARFSTHDLGTILAASGSGGAVAGAAGLQFILAPYSGSGVGFSASGCIQLVLIAGSVYHPLSVSLGPEAPKLIQYAAIGKGGATLAAPPLTYAASITAPAEATTAGMFMQGPIKHSSTALDIAGGEFNFGQEWRSDGPADLPWPVFVFQRTEAPFVRLVQKDQGAYAALAALGALSGGLHTYFRKLTADDQPALDATAAHVKLSLNAGVIMRERTGGTFRDTIDPTLRIQPVKGGSAMLTIATGSAIA